ncbi:Protein kinase-like domain protein [Paramyrothecium foliicola]|nr:Protein kinase-like domain protein [Paramyrothecium foliicola]
MCKRIDGAKLCARASQVRSGTNVPCSIDLSPRNLSAMMGGQNCHAEIKFEDGVVWIARFRLSSAISPPTEVRDYVLQSEATTMQFLERHTRIPSPRVFDWACESDPTNTIGVGYILMEKMPGTPLDWQSATAIQKEKIVRQLAEIMLEIERHPFDQLGSLITTVTSGDTTSNVTAVSQMQLGGLAQHSTFRSGEGGRPLGPFHSSQDAFRALVEAHLRMIVAGEIGTAENALDVFLAHRFRLDVLDRVSEQTATDSNGGERFFLKHTDDKGDHILVNANFEIVGIIDWEWCSTTSKQEAFSSPCMMWPVAAFYDGSNELAEEEILLARVFRESGREDLACCVLDGRKVQRLLFALGPGGASHTKRRTLASLFMGLKEAFDGHGFETDRQGVEDRWEVWKAKALEDWKHESLLKVLHKQTTH